MATSFDVWNLFLLGQILGVYITRLAWKVVVGHKNISIVIFNYSSMNDVFKFSFQFRVWAREEARDSVQYALDVGADIIDFFEEYFDLDFPLPKMGKFSSFLCNVDLVTFRM